METVIIDSNNCFITLAQGLFADPKSKYAVTDLPSIRKMVLTYVAKQMKGNNDIVLAVDDGTWRKEYFPEYKANRKTEKEKSEFPYDKFMPMFQQVIDELKQIHGKLSVVQVPGVEGDDIVAVIAPRVLPTIIHSSDQDLLQLQVFYKGVKQFNPRDWKYITPEDKSYDIFDHIIRGDAGDGVPNVLSEDRCFVDKIRQVPMIKSRYDELYGKIATPDPEGYIGDDEDLMRRYYRNKLMVDLREIPADIKVKIVEVYESSKQPGKLGDFSNHLLKHGVMI